MIEFNGLDGVLKRLEELDDPQKIEETMGKACSLIEGSAKEKAPKDTGNLRRSITSKVETDNEGVRGIIFTPLEYAPYVEYGTGLFAEDNGRSDVPWKYKDVKGNWHTTVGQKPQPFMRPALDENRQQIIEIIEEGLLHD